MEGLVEIGLAVVAGYLAVGGIAALALHFRGLPAIDPATRGAKFGFRVLVTPGLVTLWPWLFRRWIVIARSEGEESHADRPGPNLPVGARAVRRWQAFLVRTSLAVAAIGGGAALAVRVPPVDPALPPLALSLASGVVVPSAEGEPTPAVIADLGRPFPDLPIAMRLRGVDARPTLLELEVDHPIAVPSLVLYWRPGTALPDGGSPGRDARFVTRVPSPADPVRDRARVRVPLPTGAFEVEGTWVLHSIARAETIGTARATLPTAAGVEPAEGGTP